MKLFCQLFLLISSIALLGCTPDTHLPDQTFQNIQNRFQFDWQFTQGDIINAAQPEFDDSQWKTVQIPHDWSISSAANESPFSPESFDAYDTGYAKGGVGWYRKSFIVPNELRQQRVLIQFGGVYLNSTVFINGKKVGGQHNGYTSFWVDLTHQVRFGENNTLAVRVNNNQRNSRWYSGSGIYRPIKLVIKSPVDIDQWGTQVISKVQENGNATLDIKTPLLNTNTEEKTAYIKIMVLDSLGNTVAQAKKNITVSSGQQFVYNQLTLTQPKLWHPSSPHLYQLKTQIISEHTPSSEHSTTFGIRTLMFDKETGFSINGQAMLLQGMNMHHDNYMLGSAAYSRAEERKVERVLAAGYNAVRTSHNPPSQAFLDAADRLGLLVINEAFDAWNKQKWDHTNDYASRFNLDWKNDLRNFVNRDFNHPSIIMWSLGNEIPEQNEPLGAETAKTLVTTLKQLDSSRPTTIGANTAGEKADPYLNQFDIVGYNYEEKNYLNDRERNPSRIMYGSETYPNRAFDYWQYVKEHPYIIGDFVWTGWDYLGEAGIGWTGYGPNWKGIAPYPWHLAYCGEIDVLGYKRPAGFYRDVLWNTGNHKISLFVESPTPSYAPEANPDWYLFWVHPDIHPNWTWPEYDNQPLNVVVYSVYDEVELVLNNKSLGKRDNSEKNQWTLSFNVPYQAGILEARGYSNGKLVESTRLTTTEDATAFTLNADRENIKADGLDLSYLTIQLTDKNGNAIYHPQFDKSLTFTVDGPAELIGLGNGNPVSEESFQGVSRKTHNGKVVAVLRSVYNKTGKVKISVSALGLKTKTLELKTSL